MPLRDVWLYSCCGILPDLPALFIALSGNFDPSMHHHEWVTHTPLFWLICSILFCFYQKKIGLAVLIGTWGHLATDWYGGGDGIMFLWPFSREQFGVLLSGVHGRAAFEHYFSFPLFLVAEMALAIYLVYRISVQGIFK